MRTMVVTDDMPTPLVDFALSMDSSFTMTLFDGLEGLILRDLQRLDTAWVVRMKFDNSDESYELDEARSQDQVRALRQAGLDTWVVLEWDPDDVALLHPDLEFVILGPDFEDEK